jgi:hypothetical protein
MQTGGGMRSWLREHNGGSAELHGDHSVGCRTDGGVDDDGDSRTPAVNRRLAGFVIPSPGPMSEPIHHRGCTYVG